MSWLSSSSSSSSKPKGKAKLGHHWTSQIYFDPEAYEDKGTIHKITDEHLTEKLSMLDITETIKKVTVYKLPLSEWQLTMAIFYHNFILFETENWWWSIEKNSEGITIQRSKIRSAVKERYRQSDRNSGLKVIAEDISTKSVGDLMDWLYKEDELNKPYHYLWSNCKHFAQACFNYVASTKKYPSWF